MSAVAVWFYLIVLNYASDLQLSHAIGNGNQFGYNFEKSILNSMDEICLCKSKVAADALSQGINFLRFYTMLLDHRPRNK